MYVCKEYTKSVHFDEIVQNAALAVEIIFTISLPQLRWWAVKIVRSRILEATLSVADLHSKILDAPPPRSKFFQFHAVFGKIWQNLMLMPPLESWRPPPRGNHGSATDYFVCMYLDSVLESISAATQISTVVSTHFSKLKASAFPQYVKSSPTIHCG